MVPGSIIREPGRSRSGRVAPYNWEPRWRHGDKNLPPRKQRPPLKSRSGSRKLVGSRSPLPEGWHASGTRQRAVWEGINDVPAPWHDNGAPGGGAEAQLSLGGRSILRLGRGWVVTRVTCYTRTSNEQGSLPLPPVGGYTAALITSSVHSTFPPGNLTEEGERGGFLHPSVTDLGPSRPGLGMAMELINRRWPPRLVEVRCGSRLLTDERRPHLSLVRPSHCVSELQARRQAERSRVVYDGLCLVLQ